MGHWPNSNSEHLLKLHASAPCLPALARPRGCFRGPVLTTHPWVSQVCPVLQEEKARLPQRSLPLTASGSRSLEQAGLPLSGRVGRSTHWATALSGFKSAFPNRPHPCLQLPTQHPLCSSLPSGCDPGPRNCQRAPQVVGDLSRINREADCLCLPTQSATPTSVCWTLWGLFT